MEKTSSKKMTVRSIVVLIVTVIVAVAVQQFVFKAPSFDKELMNLASELNESCPIMVDQETRLDNAISLPGKIFQYNYTLVNVVKDSLDLQIFEEYMNPMLFNNVKTNPDLMEFRNNKVTIAYNYVDKFGVFLTKISITPNQYQE